MAIKKNLGLLFSSILATSLILAPGVRAEEVTFEVAQQEETQLSDGNFSATLDGGMLNNNLAPLFDRAFNHNTGTFHDITGVVGQINNIFGARTFPGSYLDNLIARDGKLVGALYTYFKEQEYNKPRLRTQDAPNPFNSSILDDPSYLSP